MECRQRTRESRQRTRESRQRTRENRQRTRENRQRTRKNRQRASGYSPAHTEKSPTHMRKSPTHMGKSPVRTGKSPTRTGKSPVRKNFRSVHWKQPPTHAKTWLPPGITGGLAGIVHAHRPHPRGTRHGSSTVGRSHAPAFDGEPGPASPAKRFEDRRPPGFQSDCPAVQWDEAAQRLRANRSEAGVPAPAWAPVVDNSPGTAGARKTGSISSSWSPPGRTLPPSGTMLVREAAVNVR